jgi:hypothetical protein
MTKLTLTAALLAASIRLALAADPATLSIVVFDDGLPVADTRVLVDGAERGRTDAYGSLRLELPAGSRELVLRGGDRDLLRLDLEFAEGESAELIASVQPDGPARVQYESSQGGQAGAAVAPLSEAPAGPPGIVAGRVVSSEGGTGVGNARIFVSGTALDVRTDAEGNFRIELPPGSYSISVIAADYDSRTFDGVAVASGETLSREIEITPAGLELPEFVVLEPFVEGSLASLVEERRDSAQVLELLGAEQISRSGDSDAAGALRRVTGLTLVDGKFIYVRGLGERYSSTLLNGAQIPSPDPTRRVVPLDLFPTEVLESIGVQKTFSADMPGEFGGGTVQLRTKSFPNDFQMKVSASVGYDDGATGEQGLTYRGGGRDWTGRDDGSRELSDQLFRDRLANFPAAEQERLAEELAAQGYNTSERRIDPNLTAAFGIGDAFGDGAWRYGYSASLRHSHQWDNREESLKSFSIIGGEVNPVPTSEFERRRTERAIDSSAYVTAGATYLEQHQLDAAIMLLRQTTDDVRIDEGYDTSPSDIERRYSLEWIENELLVKQFSGAHVLPRLADLEVDWQYTRSDASRFEPNTREYQYGIRPGQSEFGLIRGSSGNAQRAAQLDDASREYRLGFSMPMEFGSEWDLSLNAGAGRLERERDSVIRRYRFRIGNSPLLRDINDIEALFAPEFIGTDISLVTLIDGFQPSDVYMASQELLSGYLSADVAFADDYRLNIGLRREDNDLVVTTFQPFNPNAEPDVGAVQEVDNLPAATFTWAYSDSAQFRVGYSETLSRPDFRELTLSPFTDPLLDVTTRGNPDLRQSRISNYDLRWEYYFSGTEILSLALFLKEFEDPIEIVRVPGTGQLLEPQNALEATNYGFEIDYYKSLSDLRRWDWFDRSWAGRIPWQDVYLGFNYAWIDSEITLGEDIIGIQTTDNRPLQGQSPYVFNLQLGYRQPDGRREVTLLYNVIGERIVGVGVRELPDIYEQPLHQVDLVWSQRLGEDWKFRLRLRNLLGEDVEFSQGGLPTRLYEKGRDVTLSFERSW